MTSTIPTRPSKPLNWAEDDEDDFDLETWKASADISAPTVEDLGPLQRSLNEDESPLILSVSKFANNPTARVSTETIPSTNTKSQAELSEQDPQIQADDAQELEYIQAQKLFNENALEYECNQGRIRLLEFALREKPGTPAYWELSFYSEGPYSPDRRVEYTRNWNDAKSCGGTNLQRDFQYKSSPLSRVMLVEDQEPDLESDLEWLNKATEDVGEVPLDIGTGWELEEAFEEKREVCAIPRPGSPVPWIRGKERKAFDVSKMGSAFEDSDSDEEDEQDDVPMEPPKTQPLENCIKSYKTLCEPIIASSDDSVSDRDFDFDDVFENSYDQPMCDKNLGGSTGLGQAFDPKNCLSFGCYNVPLHPYPVNEDTGFELRPKRTTRIEDAASKYKAALKTNDKKYGPQKMDSSAQKSAEDIFWAPVPSTDIVKSHGIQMDLLYNDLQIPLRDQNSCVTSDPPTPSSSDSTIEILTDKQSKTSLTSSLHLVEPPTSVSKSTLAEPVSSHELPSHKPVTRSPWRTASAYAAALMGAGLIYFVSSMASVNGQLGFHFLLFCLVLIL